MAPISDTWPDVQLSLDVLPPEFADRVTSLVEWLTPHFEAIEAYAKDLHPKKRSCRLVKDNYTWGQSFIVFELVFDKKEESGDVPEEGVKEEEGEKREGEEDVEESWIIRFGMRPMDAYFNTAAQLERKMMNEAAALQLVSTRTTIPVPKILAFHPVAGDSDPSEHQFEHGDHPLGPKFPAFVLMTAIRGITIEDCGIAIYELGQADPNSDLLQGDESKRLILKRYLRDIADIHVQLSKITFDKIGGFVLDKDGNVSVGPGADFGLGPFNSAKEYFSIQAEAYEKLAEAASEGEAEEGEPGVEGEESAELLKRRFVASLWKTAMMPLVDERDASGPFPMRHGDLHSENILVDETGHIMGVLDWDCAATVPWEAFAVPTFEVSGHIEEPTPPGTSLQTGSVAQQKSSEEQVNEIGKELKTENQDENDKGLPCQGHKRNPSRPQVHEEFNKALAEIELEASASSCSDLDSLGSSPSIPTVSLDNSENLQPPAVTASGRSLAALHDSDAGYVGAYLAYWMYSLACDYEETGRALHRMLVTRASQNGVENGEGKPWVLEGDMEEAFKKFVREMRSERTAGSTPA